MQDERTNTETKDVQYNADINMDSEITERQETLDYKVVDTRINTIPTPIGKDIKFMVEVPVPLVNWELDLTLYEKGLLFFKQANQVGSVLLKIIKFIIIIWVPLNYIRQFINERRRT